MKPAAIFFSFALCATAQLRELPEVLKNPGKLQPWHNLMAKHQVKLETPPDPPRTCSVPLTEFKPTVESRMPVIRPQAESNMPLIVTPEPPCANPQ